MTKPMLRVRPDGCELTWRVAAMSRFKEEGRASKPFFITWDDPSVRPDKVRAAVQWRNIAKISFMSQMQ